MIARKLKVSVYTSWVGLSLAKLNIQPNKKKIGLDWVGFEKFFTEPNSNQFSHEWVGLG